jgi:hypothetical protein
LNGAIAKVYVKNNVLYFFVPGQPDYELTPNGNNKFTIKTLSGYSLQFQKDENGIVSAVSFIQPNGILKQVKRNEDHYSKSNKR